MEDDVAFVAVGTQSDEERIGERKKEKPTTSVGVDLSNRRQRKRGWPSGCTGAALSVAFVLAFLGVWSSYRVLTEPFASRKGPDETLPSAERRTKGSRKEGLATYYDPHRFTHLQEEVDNEDEKTRCERYGFGYDPNRSREQRRRIFFGSAICDESLEVLSAFAAEMYGMLHTVAYVESNTTAIRTPREVRFSEGSEELALLQNGMYGPDTKVSVDMYHDNDDGGASHLVRDHVQRELVLLRWKENGMRPDDIGIISDPDETFTRDFLRAAQICDVKEFRPGQDCLSPKVMGWTLIFESSPECITDIRRWYHPDMIIGECILHIGDTSVHMDPPREWRGRHGRRVPMYSPRQITQNASWPSGPYPIWNAADFRGTKSSFSTPISEKGIYRGIPGVDTHRSTGFHFHNWFTDSFKLRNKYLTYSHADEGANQKRLIDIHRDIKMAVNCVLGIPDEENATVKRMQGGFSSLKGPTPIYFQDREYRKRRHDHWLDMVHFDLKHFERQMLLHSTEQGVS